MKPTSPTVFSLDFKLLPNLDIQPEIGVFAFYEVRRVLRATIDNFETSSGAPMVQ